MVGDKASPQSLQASISHFKGSVELGKWFSSDTHAQVTADTYDLFIVMINPVAAKFWFGRRAHSSLLRKSGLLYIQQGSWGCYLAGPVVQSIGTL